MYVCCISSLVTIEENICISRNLFGGTENQICQKANHLLRNLNKFKYWDGTIKCFKLLR